MSGWIILFALLALTGNVLAAFQTAARATACEAMGVVFTVLLIIALLMRALRTRA